MKQFSILIYNEKENRTSTWDSNSIDEMRTAVFLSGVNNKSEVMVFTNPGANLIYYSPAKGRTTVDTWKLNRY